MCRRRGAYLGLKRGGLLEEGVPSSVDWWGGMEACEAGSWLTRRTS